MPLDRPGAVGGLPQPIPSVRLGYHLFFGCNCQAHLSGGVLGVGYPFDAAAAASYGGRLGTIAAGGGLTQGVGRSGPGSP